MDGVRLTTLRYFLISQENRAAHQGIYEAAFRFWKSFWGDVYRSVGSDHGPDDRDFYRQSYLSVLMENDEVVALHTYTAFDLTRDADRNHPYFQRYYEPAIVDATRRRDPRVLTMEFFSVSREWRSKQVGMSFASVVAGLGVRLAKSLGVGIVSAARTDVHADRIGKAFGAETIGTTVTNGVKTELLLFPSKTMHPHADGELERWVEYFWAKRNGQNSGESMIAKQFDTTIAAVGEKVMTFPWEDRNAYGLWLAQTYYLVRHTSTLIALLAGKVGVHDPARHRELLAHLRDETGHEEFAKRDLAALGLSLESFPELVQTSVIYQGQYFRIDRMMPLGLFGYALMLEGVASKVGPGLYDRVVAAHGKKAATFLDLHAREDETHYPQGVAWLSSFPADAQTSVLENLRQSAVLYPSMLEAAKAYAAALAVPAKRAA